MEDGIANNVCWSCLGRNSGGVLDYGRPVSPSSSPETAKQMRWRSIALASQHPERFADSIDALYGGPNHPLHIASPRNSAAEMEDLSQRQPVALDLKDKRPVVVSMVSGNCTGSSGGQINCDTSGFASCF